MNLLSRINLVALSSVLVLSPLIPSTGVLAAPQRAVAVDVDESHAQEETPGVSARGDDPEPRTPATVQARTAAGFPTLPPSGLALSTAPHDVRPGVVWITGGVQVVLRITDEINRDDGTPAPRRRLSAQVGETRAAVTIKDYEAKLGLECDSEDESCWIGTGVVLQPRADGDVLALLETVLNTEESSGPYPLYALQLHFDPASGQVSVVNEWYGDPAKRRMPRWARVPGPTDAIRRTFDECIAAAESDDNAALQERLTALRRMQDLTAAERCERTSRDVRKRKADQKVVLKQRCSKARAWFAGAVSCSMLAEATPNLLRETPTQLTYRIRWDIVRALGDNLLPLRTLGMLGAVRAWYQTGFTGQLAWIDEYDRPIFRCQLRNTQAKTILDAVHCD